jgi:hypothetical protein
MKNIIVCFGCIIICFGCSQSKNKVTEITGFASSHNIAGTEISLNTEVLFPKKLLLFNDTTLIITEKKTEYDVLILAINGDSVNLIKELEEVPEML